MTRLAAGLVVATLVSCSASVRAADDAFGSAGGVLEEETRVYLGTCFFSETPAPSRGRALPLAAILGVALKETVVDFAVGALKAAGEDKSTQAIAAYPANGWMYQLDTEARLTLNPNTRCVQIISGAFWNGLRLRDSETATTAPSRDNTQSVRLDQRIEATARDADGQQAAIARWEASSPLFPTLKARFRQLKWARLFFEARVDSLSGSDDKFVLSPNAFYFEKPVDGSFFDAFGAPTRNVLVTITFATAGAELGKAFASVNFPFRNMPSNTLLTPLYFKDQTSRAIQAPELTEDEKKAVVAKKAKLGLASGEVSLVKGPPQPPAYVPPNSFENPSYVASARAYCAALDAFNSAAAVANRKAIAATAPECPVDLQLAKLAVTQARGAFDKRVAMEQAVFNTANSWTLKPDDPQSPGVACVPKNDGLINFESGCTLSRASDIRAITVSASVIEIRQGSKFAAFLGKVLEKAQPNINASIEANTSEKKSEASEQSNKDAEAHQLAIADVAVGEAKLAEVLTKAGATESEKAQAELDLLQKKIFANQSARKAGVSEPFKIP